MALADLHVHSVHSEHPSEWFLQRIGAAESYTDPAYIYSTALENGMNFVTITDHNRISGALLLQKEHPEVAFISVESTVYFPEDGCKIHLLMYGISEDQFKEIQKLRKDVYSLRDYIIEENIAYSVAHATYSVNNKLNITHLERLILLFDIFESHNGGRNKYHNETWLQSLKSLTPEIIEELRKKYDIEPISNDPWIKGFTGGSDDHAGFFISKTYTYGEAETIDEFLEQIRDKRTLAGGRFNDYKSLAFTIYKIAYDFSKTKSGGLPHPIIQQFSDSLFEKKSSSFFSKIKIISFLHRKKLKEDPIKRKIYETIQSIQNSAYTTMEDKLNYIYNQLSDISDELFIRLTNKVLEDLKSGDLFNIVKGLAGTLPGIFVSIPFFSTLKHMFSGRELLNELEERFIKKQKKSKKILWFTDTITDLNGVSFIVKKIAQLAFERKLDITLVVSLKQEEMKNLNLPPTSINISSIYEIELPLYASIKIRIPSVLSTLNIISQYQPDEIYISTPGPIGLTGLLMSKLMSIPVTGIYHTDFKKQYEAIDEDGTIKELIENSIRWFYMNMDRIKVPTQEYIQILAKRGYREEKMSIFRRGIEEDIFFPLANARENMKLKYSLSESTYLLYAGRISKDKNLSFLCQVFEQLQRKHKKIKLLIAGDGPYLEEIRNEKSNNQEIVFLGKIERDMLPLLYAGSDLFVFPSTTDTFGMVVLEAQACGLPAVVSNIGGPKEIVIHEETGFILEADHNEEWVKTLDGLISKINQNDEQIKQMRISSHENIIKTCNWDIVLEDITGKSENLEKSAENNQIPKW